MKPWHCLWIGVFITFTTAADQFQIASFEEARQLFWKQIYPNGGWTLYCGEYFESPEQMVIDEIYAKEWAAQHLKCGTVDQCRAQNAKFSRLESDLHNMYPEVVRIAEVRSDYSFGPIAGEFREFFECNFEYDARDRLVEPRGTAQGNIARALLYMHLEYELPLERAFLDRMLEWNRNDPPSKDELRRNDIIEKLQGTRNPFIDNPALADNILARKKNLPASKGEGF